MQEDCEVQPLKIKDYTQQTQNMCITYFEQNNFKENATAHSNQSACRHNLYYRIRIFRVRSWLSERPGQITISRHPLYMSRRTLMFSYGCNVHDMFQCGNMAFIKCLSQF